LRNVFLNDDLFFSILNDILFNQPIVWIKIRVL